MNGAPIPRRGEHNSDIFVAGPVKSSYACRGRARRVVCICTSVLTIDDDRASYEGLDKRWPTSTLRPSSALARDRGLKFRHQPICPAVSNLTSTDLRTIDYFTVKHLQQFLHMGRTAVYALIRADGFPPPICPGRAYLWPADEVRGWAARQPRVDVVRRPVTSHTLPANELPPVVPVTPLRRPKVT